jgi:DNA-binding MarR family transcriptional regulator
MDLPETLSARTAYLLGRAADEVKALGESDLAPLEITPREYSVLAVLAEHSPLSQTRVAEILGLDRTTILKVAASLEQHGLVVRARDDSDRRAYAMALTATGDEVRAQALKLLLGCERRFLEPLEPEERHQLHELLLRLIEGEREPQDRPA